MGLVLQLSLSPPKTVIIFNFFPLHVAYNYSTSRHILRCLLTPLLSALGKNHVQGQRTMDDLTAGWCAMSSAENPSLSNKAKTADDYRAEADEILNRLRDVLKERPEADVPSQCVSTIMWWEEIISMRLRFN
ncbi:uncharacterized protein FFB14_15325 [Fusarium fujikuroi]|nr:uncharacterized protein FFB14_15325 [Fusarium fujikuroi]